MKTSWYKQKTLEINASMKELREMYPVEIRHKIAVDNLINMAIPFCFQIINAFGRLLAGQSIGRLPRPKPTKGKSHFKIIDMGDKFTANRDKLWD